MRAVRIPRFLLVHTVDVEPYLGRGRSGPTYGPVYTSEGVYVEQRPRRAVGPDGEEVQAHATIYYVKASDVPALGSRITYDGNVFTVVEQEKFDSAVGGYGAAICE